MIKRILNRLSSRTLATMIISGIIALFTAVIAVDGIRILLMTTMAGAMGVLLYLSICWVAELIDDIRNNEKELK